MLFRARLPNIINLAVSRSQNALRILVDQCHITASQLCALAIRASANGPAGVEDVFDRIVVSSMNLFNCEVHFVFANISVVFLNIKIFSLQLQ